MILSVDYLLDLITAVRTADDEEVVKAAKNLVEDGKVALSLHDWHTGLIDCDDWTIHNVKIAYVATELSSTARLIIKKHHAWMAARIIQSNDIVRPAGVTPMASEILVSLVSLIHAFDNTYSPARDRDGLPALAFLLADLAESAGYHDEENPPKLPGAEWTVESVDWVLERVSEDMPRLES